MKAGEIFVELKLNKSKFDEGLGNSRKSLKMFALEIAAGAYLLDRFVTGVTNSANTLKNLSIGSGVAASKLGKYGLAANLLNTGIKAEEASAQIADFAKNLVSLQTTGQGNTGLFQKLNFFGRGVEFIGKDTEQVISDVKKALVGLSDVQAAAVLEAGGLSAAMLPFFRASNEEVDRLTAGIAMTDSDIAKLDKAGQAINSFKRDVISLQTAIVSDLAPTIRMLGEEFKNLNSEDLKALQIILKAIATSVVTAATAIETIAAAGKILSGVSDNEAIAVADETTSMWRKRLESVKRLWKSTPEATPPTTPQSGLPRLNNFGNIRGSNGEFKNFTSPQEGMNALVADVAAKVSGRSKAMSARYGKGYTPTLDSLINTYAPPSENNTQSYVNFMSQQTGLSPNARLTANDIESIVRGIIKMENNKNIVFNNTNHIHGGDAKTAADMTSTQIEKMLKNSVANLNNGAY